MTVALETKALEKQFGGLRVTRDLSLRVEQGARHALSGRTAPARPPSSIF